jgi:hypothetical protein
MSKQPSREDWVWFAYRIVWEIGQEKGIGSIEDLKNAYRRIYGKEMST